MLECPDTEWVLMSTRQEKKIKRENTNYNIRVRRDDDDAIILFSSGLMGKKHLAAPPGTALMNTITPCAACKLLRRRCAQDCPFSPYFSPHEPHKFAAVHKVFGASNVSKMLMEVGKSQRADAANSMVYEANLRLRDPVYGCMGVISALQQQIQSLQAELNAVRAEIDLRYKYREVTANDSNNHIINIPTSHTNTVVPVAAAAAPPPLNPSPPSQLPQSLPPKAPLILSSSAPVMVSSSSSSSSSTSTSLYNPPCSTAGYSCMTSDNNVPYLD